MRKTIRRLTKYLKIGGAANLLPFIRLMMDTAPTDSSKKGTFIEKSSASGSLILLFYSHITCFTV